MSDHVHIEQLAVFAHIGVPDEERSSPQRLTFSITLWPMRDASELGDQIAKAVNYAARLSISYSRGAREVDRANLSLEAARYAASCTSTA